MFQRGKCDRTVSDPLRRRQTSAAALLLSRRSGISMTRWRPTVMMIGSAGKIGTSMVLWRRRLWRRMLGRRHGKRRFGKTKHGKRRFGKTKHGKRRFGKTKHGNRRFGKTKHGRRRFGKRRKHCWRWLGRRLLGRRRHGRRRLRLRSRRLGRRRHGRRRLGRRLLGRRRHGRRRLGRRRHGRRRLGRRLLGRRRHGRRRLRLRSRRLGRRRHGRRRLRLSSRRLGRRRHGRRGVGEMLQQVQSARNVCPQSKRASAWTYTIAILRVLCENSFRDTQEETSQGMTATIRLQKRTLDSKQPFMHPFGVTMSLKEKFAVLRKRLRSQQQLASWQTLMWWRRHDFCRPRWK